MSLHYDKNERDSANNQVTDAAKNSPAEFETLFPERSEQPTAEHSSQSSEAVATTNERNDERSIDDSFETQVRSTAAQVSGTFQKFLDPDYVQATVGNFGALINPSREKGGQVKHLPPNDDDSFVTQIKHTEEQVTNTFRDLSATLQQAGVKITEAFSGAGDPFSSKKD